MYIKVHRKNWMWLHVNHCDIMRYTCKCSNQLCGRRCCFHLGLLTFVNRLVQMCLILKKRHRCKQILYSKPMLQWFAVCCSYCFSGNMQCCPTSLCNIIVQHNCDPTISNYGDAWCCMHANSSWNQIRSVYNIRSSTGWAISTTTERRDIPSTYLAHPKW